MPITVITIVGRTLLALLFILAGVAKIAGPQPFLDHMAAHHIPGLLLWPVILLELSAGGAVLIEHGGVGHTEHHAPVRVGTGPMPGTIRTAAARR